MKPRKGVHIAGLALAAIVLLAPSIANAQWWWFDHKQGRYPVSTFKKVVEPTLNEISLTTETGKKLGPCKGVIMKGEIYSKFGGMGEGSLGPGKNEEKGCETTVAECTVKKLEPKASVAWALTLKEDKTVEISNFALTVERTGKCEGTKLPEEFEITGTAKATWIDYGFGEPGSEVKFDEFEVEVGATKLRIDGSLVFGTEVTTKVEPEGFSPEYSPALLNGADIFGPFVFTRTGHPVECEEATLTGTAKEDDHTVTVTPTYSNCGVSGLPATMKMNGCKYLLHLEAEFVAGETYEYLASTDLKCAEKPAELEIFLNKESHEKGTALCRFTFGETGNQGREVVELTNKGSTSTDEDGWLEAHVDVKELSSKRVAGSALFCGTELDATGTLEGTYEITGETEGKEENGIGVFP